MKKSHTSGDTFLLMLLVRGYIQRVDGVVVEVKQWHISLIDVSAVCCLLIYSTNSQQKPSLLHNP